MNPELETTCPKSPNGTHDWAAMEEGLYDIPMFCRWCRRTVYD